MDACERPSCLQLLLHPLFDEERLFDCAESAATNVSHHSPAAEPLCHNQGGRDSHQLAHIGPAKTPSQKVDLLSSPRADRRGVYGFTVDLLSSPGADLHVEQSLGV